MASRSAALAARASSGVAVGLDRCARSSPASATRCSSTSVGTRVPTFSSGRPSAGRRGRAAPRSRAISSWARRLGGCFFSSSVTGTPSAAASCSTSDSFGSRLPFSISESTDGRPADPRRRDRRGSGRAPGARAGAAGRTSQGLDLRSLPIFAILSSVKLSVTCHRSENIEVFYRRQSWAARRSVAAPWDTRHGRGDSTGAAPEERHDHGDDQPAGGQSAAEWETDPRWAGIKRTYTAEDVDPAARLGRRGAHAGPARRRAAVGAAARPRTPCARSAR